MYVNMYMYAWISFSLPGIGRDKRCVEPSELIHLQQHVRNNREIFRQEIFLLRNFSVRNAYVKANQHQQWFTMILPKYHKSILNFSNQENYFPNYFPNYFSNKRVLLARKQDIFVYICIYVYIVVYIYTYHRIIIICWEVTSQKHSVGPNNGNVLY